MLSWISFLGSSIGLNKLVVFSKFMFIVVFGGSLVVSFFMRMGLGFGNNFGYILVG